MDDAARVLFPALGGGDPPHQLPDVAAGCTRGPRAAPMCAVDYNLYMIAVDIVGCAAAAHFLHRRCFCHRHFFMLS